MYIFHNGIGKPVHGAVQQIGGGGFSPTSVSNLTLWLDAADSATITQTGGNVSQWDDKSGNGYHVTQSVGANQPTTNSRTINGLNVLDFDGSDYLLRDTTPNISQPNTIFVVVQHDNSNNGYYVDGDSTSGSVRNAISSNSGSGQFHLYSGFSIFGGTMDQNLHIFTGIFNGGSSKLYQEGTQIAGANAGSYSLRGLSVGVRASRSDNYLDGIIGEIIIYDALLSDEDKNQVGQYLADKWGTTWTDI